KFSRLSEDVRWGGKADRGFADQGHHGGGKRLFASRAPNEQRCNAGRSEAKSHRAGSKTAGPPERSELALKVAQIGIWVRGQSVSSHGGTAEGEAHSFAAD